MAKRPSAVRIGPFAAGLVTAYDSQDIPAKVRADGSPAGLYRAVNVDIDRSGKARRRSGWRQIDESVAHSLYPFPSERCTYAVIDGELCRLDRSGPLALAPVKGPVAWGELLGQPMFSDAYGVYWIVGEAVLPLPAGGPAEDDEALVLEPLPAGRFLTTWSGRVVVASGAALVFSEPMRYGRTDAARGRMALEGAPHWVLGLDGGLYVGLSDRVLFLRGRGDLFALEREEVGGPSWRGAAIVASTDGWPDKISGGFGSVAIWLGANGYCVGRPDGSVVQPQAGRIEGLQVRAGRMVYADRRVWVTEVSE